MTKDYSQGKVYKIQCGATGEIYVGSTTKKYLSQRLTKHVSNYHDWLKGGKSTYMTSYSIIERGDYKILLLEAYPCSSSDELRSREQHYIDTLECVNKAPAYKSEEDQKAHKRDYYLENRDKHLDRNKANYQANKEARNQQSKQWYEENKEHFKNYVKHRYEENKEEILTKQKEYYQANREKIRKRYSAKVKCECGSEVSKANFARHKKESCALVI